MHNTIRTEKQSGEPITLKDFTIYFWFLQESLIPIRQSRYWSTWTPKNALWSNPRLSLLVFTPSVLLSPIWAIIFNSKDFSLGFGFLNVMNIQLLVSMPTRVLTACFWKLQFRISHSNCIIYSLPLSIFGSLSPYKNMTYCHSEHTEKQALAVFCSCFITFFKS